MAKKTAKRGVLRGTSRQAGSRVRRVRAEPGPSGTLLWAVGAAAMRAPRGSELEDVDLERGGEAAGAGLQAVARRRSGERDAAYSRLAGGEAGAAADVHSADSESGKGHSKKGLLENEPGPDGDGESKKRASFTHLSLKRLLAQAKPERGRLIVATVCLFLGALATLSIPFFFGRIIDAITAPDGGDEARADLTENIVSLVIVTLIGSCFSFARGYLFNSTGEMVVARLRRQLFSAILRQEIGYFDATRTGELLSRLGNDVGILKNVVTVNISMALRWAATCIGGLIFLFVQSWKLSLVILLLVPALAISARAYGAFVRKLSKQTQEALARATEVAEESISSVRTVRSFAREQQQQAAYDERVAETLRLGLKTSLAYGGFTGGLTGVVTLAFIVIVFYGGTLVIDGELTSGVLTSFLLYSLTIGGALAGLAGLFGQLMSAAGANERVFAILDRVPAIPLTGGEAGRKLAGHIAFRGVDFAYPTRPDLQVLTDVTFDLPPGTVAAFVGPSGGGKSTIINLVERFYDSKAGAVLLDGMDIRTLDPSWYRRQIGLVRQEPVLFSGTIRENIAFGLTRPATNEEVVAAAKQANAHDFISGFTEGYDTVVGERGVRLSGGQKQRIAIARALLMSPRILLLDEATSALDAESEHLVQEALDHLMEGRTTLIVAHRLSTVRDASTVIVVDGGRVVAQGTHSELMRSSELYERLVKRQLVEAEAPVKGGAGAAGAAVSGEAASTADAAVS